ncbi:DUF29 domain-containing protein [Azospirillum thermophilum]|uniref:DUF29 domain-containing protein n=1 Tax=Azospirillum thermophilum TaxID=2202148 RepID=A0A2S2CM29_9PROT|nr:DUF29 domain-containing protein [Azospirillum thermophilum]AWK85531.1 DUF29 domain-containing protein [Azospirillum thermophilum]
MGFHAKHDEDFYAWAMEQAARLREAAASGTNLPLDWENLAEEIESMGRSDRREAISRLSRIIEHLLKLEHSPAEQPREAWRRSVVEQRMSLPLLLDDSPSLRAKLDGFLEDAWRQGRREALYGLERDCVFDRDLPRDCPYRVEELLDEAFWPPNRHGLA